jgi:hypothetical protein
MRLLSILAAGCVTLAAVALAQQPAPPSQPAQSPTTQSGSPMTPGFKPAIVVYRIDLNPTGSIFAMNEPVLEGDTYVFKSLPERAETRLQKSKVKQVVRWTTDVEKEVVWQIDVEPSGSYLAREEPMKKGKNWVVKAFKQGQLVSIPQSDVKKVTRLNGKEAYRAELKELGLVVLEGETTEAGFKPDAPGNPSGGAPAGAPPQGAQQPGNWTYQGQPGATDAYAPAGGTVAKPGDVPMAPTPR